MVLITKLELSGAGGSSSALNRPTAGTQACVPRNLAQLLYYTVRRYHPCKDNFHDIVVIGGGILGAASARELIIRQPTFKIALVEKEDNFACHQSGNNSGVIHAGIYYEPGSLKAKLCVQGAELTYKYCDEKGIRYKKCGKLIVAIDRSEIPRLCDLCNRGVKNGVKDLKLLNFPEIIACEPRCKGVMALWSPHTGIVDWGEVARSYVCDFAQRGGSTYLNFEVTRFHEADYGDYPVIISDRTGNSLKAKYVLTCCGLHSDTIAVLTGCSEDPKIIPFRGEYLFLTKDKSDLVKTNIYPVPDPRFPFLGVHLTPTIDGRIILGPNALLAFSKEGYSWTDVNFSELKDMVAYSGLRQLISKHAVYGVMEVARSVIKPLQVRQLQKYVHNLTSFSVERGPVGVRAQAMKKDGTLIEDFVLDWKPLRSGIGGRVLHVRNAPSPGATSSLAIAKMLADKMKKIFKF